MKMIKNYLYIAFVISASLSSCRGYENKKTDTAITSDTLIDIDEYEFVSYNYCSPNLLFDDHVSGNTIVHITPSNNFLKCTVFNDTEFVFSCGRGKKEVVILPKVECGSAGVVLGFDGLSMPKLKFDDEDIMILHYKAGSDSWTDYFIHLSKNKVYSEQALYIDNDNRKYVYLGGSDYENKKVFFVVHDIMSNSRDTLNSNYYEFRQDGYPALNMSNVLLSHDTLFYSIDLGSNMVRDTLIY